MSDDLNQEFVASSDDQKQEQRQVESDAKETSDETSEKPIDDNLVAQVENEETGDQKQEQRQVESDAKETSDETSEKPIDDNLVVQVENEETGDQKQEQRQVESDAKETSDETSEKPIDDNLVAQVENEETGDQKQEQRQVESDAKETSNETPEKPKDDNLVAQVEDEETGDVDRTSQISADIEALLKGESIESDIQLDVCEETAETQKSRLDIQNEEMQESQPDIQNEETVDSSKEEREMAYSADIEDFENMVTTRRDSQELAVEDIFSIKEETPSTKDALKKSSMISIVTPPRFPQASLREFTTYHKSFQRFSVSQIDVTSEESLLSLVVPPTPPPEKEEVKIDRVMYYELHQHYTKRYQMEKIKNTYLQNRLADYYKKRRMYHVFINDPKTQQEYAKKYEKLLETLDNTNDAAAREQAAVEGETEDLRNKCRSKNEEVTALFERLQRAETDLTKEIVNNVAMNYGPATEKGLERLIKRQRSQRTDLSKLQLKYIKLRNKYNEKQEILDSLDHLGPNYHLIDYEQLKCDNRNLYDKLEEKELFLTSVRRECQNVMQILAHTREKSSVLDQDLQGYKDRLENVLGDCMDAREQLSSLKQERNYFRRLTSKLKQKAGLMAQPRLLRDMEQAMNEVDTGMRQLREYKDSYVSTSQSLIMVRQHMSKVAIGGTKSKKATVPQRIRYGGEEAVELAV